MRLALALSALLACLLVPASAASAAITHEFLPALTSALEAGVPESASPSEASLKGPLSGVSALVARDERLWVAERIEKGPDLAKSRVDQFDVKAGPGEGAFLPPQLREEAGSSSLYDGVAASGAPGSERVFVGAGQSGKNVVAVFEGGKQAGAWSGLETPQKAFGSIVGVAVDESGDLETNGDELVATNITSNAVDVYAPASGGAEPALLGQLTGTPSGPFKDPHGVAVSPLNGDVVVADGNPEACSREESECLVDVFEPVPGSPGSYAFAFAIGEGSRIPPQGQLKRLGPLAVDGAGDIYVVERQREIVEQFDAEGHYVGQLTGTSSGGAQTPFATIHSIAADASSGEVFVGDFSERFKAGSVDAFGPSEVVPDVQTLSASGVTVGGEGQIEATLNGSVNPLSEGPAECQFALGQGESLSELVPCKEKKLEGSSPIAVDGQASSLAPADLAPDTTYAFRLQASNKNGFNPGEATQNLSLHTPGPGIHSESSADVSSTAASLQATIDPNGAPTSYYFQYGTSSSYGSQTPAAAEAIGEGEGDVQVTPQRIQGLSPDTTYHYRVVAISQIEGKEVSFFGVDHTLMTSAAPPALLDNRRWELVSPQEKHGALLEGIETGVIQAAANGQAVSYLADLPTEEGVKGYLIKGLQILSRRGAGGWTSKDLSLAHPEPSGVPGSIGKEYRSFSPNLQAAIVEPLGVFSSLLPEAFPPDSERTPYLRHDESCEASPSTCYEPLVTGAPGYADVPEGTKFGGDPKGGSAKDPFVGEANFVGATADLSRVVLESSVALTATPTNGKVELYEWSAAAPPTQRIKLISALPEKAPGEEAPAATNASFGYRHEVARDAISSDGSRVFWSEEGGHLYVRDASKEQTVQLDVPEAGCGSCAEESPAARFQLASADGSRALFTDSQRLSSNASDVAGTSDLYECQLVEVEGQLTCQLRDLTPSPGPRQAADVQGMAIGASADASWIYFAANGLLGDAKERGASEGDCKLNAATGEGQCNLYVLHNGQIQLISEVSGKDYPDWGGEGGNLLEKLTARVSENGRWLAFMSQLPLTGYDNMDAISGKADEEVFLYHAEEGGAGSLVCASCDPSGARPKGVEYGENTLIGGFLVWEAGAWLAANVPGYTPYQQESALYQSRYLSDAGRLFFNSNDALVPEDVNENQDVYEYEPPGVGSCSEGAAAFHASQDGCLALVSSGRAQGESAFVDASESGDDVFFLTSEELAKKDIDTARDLYDAHVCQSAADCPEEASAPSPCQSAESCRGPASPPAIFAEPPSQSFTGEGNLAPPAPRPAAKPTKKQLLAKALAACRHKYKGKAKKRKKRRASCEAAARKRYGAKQAKKKKQKKKQHKRKGARR